LIPTQRRLFRAHWFTLECLSVGTAPAFSAVAGAAPALSWGFGGWNSWEPRLDSLREL